MTSIDARGLSCPQPIILLKKVLADRPESCEIIVDNGAARDNVCRFAADRGYTTQESKEGAEYHLRLHKA